MRREKQRQPVEKEKKIRREKVKLFIWNKNREENISFFWLSIRNTSSFYSALG